MTEIRTEHQSDLVPVHGILDARAAYEDRVSDATALALIHGGLSNPGILADLAANHPAVLGLRDNKEPEVPTDASQ